MPKILLVSLFRSGTSSVGKYMHSAYGIKLAHNGNSAYSCKEGEKGWDRDKYIELYSQASRGDFNLNIFKDPECNGLAVYPASSHYEGIAEANPDTIYIHVTRNKKSG